MEISAVLLGREKGQCMKLKKVSNYFLSNHLKKALKLLTTGLLFLWLICSFNSITAQADELYFDEQGNLYFHSRDKEASGSVRYKTIGWVIKRYDMPMEAPGQQYVIVTKRQYKPNEPDPDNEGYVFCYFWSDKTEILSAVQSVSQEWYNILTGYGDDVYIDSVMTVVNGTKELGALYAGGEYSGEVYFTFEGIANARNWASPESLRDDYDNKVAFPQIVHKKERQVDVIKREDIYFNTSQYSAFVVGAGTYGREPFDVSKGIPSGKALYVKGRADSTQAVLKLTKVTARMTECIEVPVTYLLRWQDYYGNYKHDTRVIYRYYDVVRDFTYYEFGGMDIYDLSEVRVTGSILENGGVTDSSVAAKGNITWEHKAYGSAEEHIVSYHVKVTSSIGTMLLVGEDGKKPTIPDADYSEVAEGFLGDVYVKNDRVVINGATALSDETSFKNGVAPRVMLYSPETDIYIENINIAAAAPNGECKDCSVELIYKNADGKMLKYKDMLNTITVHTPVYCDVSVYTDKELNQAVEPAIGDVVLGEYMTISFNDFGMHRDIKGYGLRSYTSYVGVRQVCCPFSVEYNGVAYEADTWIRVEGHSIALRVLEDNEEGEYVIYARTQAYNGMTDMDDRAIEESANLAIESYGAWDLVKVRIIGRLHKLKLECNGAIYDASRLPANVAGTDEEVQIMGNSGTCHLSFETVGNVEKNDTVEIRYSYYHEDKDGALTPVHVYGVKDRNYLDGVITGGFADKEILTFSYNGGYESNEENQHNESSVIWSTDIQLYEELLVVPRDISAEDIKVAIRENRMQDICLSGGAVIVCADIISCKEGVPYLSYINEENAKKGYCNMWLKEGGGERYPYGAVLRLSLGDYTYYDYEVSGTH